VFFFCLYYSTFLSATCFSDNYDVIIIIIIIITSDSSFSFSVAAFASASAFASNSSLDFASFSTLVYALLGSNFCFFLASLPFLSIFSLSLLFLSVGASSSSFFEPE
jgi:hypothetical protein